MSEEVSTGASAEPQAQVSEFGFKHLGLRTWVATEDNLCEALKSWGSHVRQAGSRYQNYDLEILDCANLPLGRYEIKALHRNGKSFDRRFKVGSRSEKIYGKRDAEIKAAALVLDDYIDWVFKEPDRAVQRNEYSADANLQWILNLKNQAFERKHGKNFIKDFIENIKPFHDWHYAYPFKINKLSRPVTSKEICEGYSDIQGIFLVLEDNYTLIRHDEFAKFIEFDSASSEGIKLRYTGKLL